MSARRVILGALFLLAASAVAVEANSFRVTPYVQHPATNAMTLMWLAQTNGSASVSWWQVGAALTNTLATATPIDSADRVAGSRFTRDGQIEYCLAPELGYNLGPDNDANRRGAWEMPYTTPWQYRVRLVGLAPGTQYGYRVTLAGGASYEKTFKTTPAHWQPMRFIYYSDSETEPADNAESTGRTSDWESDVRSAKKYYATQTQCYATNIVHAVNFNPDLIVMAGDLAQKGSKQCDWDEFWRHNAGGLNDPAGSIPIVASPGNHDYWDYRDGGNVGIAKYLSYFEFEPNGTTAGEKQQELFHRVDYGPVTFLFIDANNGDDAVVEKDTSRQMHRAADGTYGGCLAPDFNPGSVQYQWLEENLADAQQKSAFTFVVCHQCPYSCGYHGGPQGEKGNSQGLDDQSGRALRALVPMFLKYGVDGWLCGHDEMMEHSVTNGFETLPDGTQVAHQLHVWDMGIAGDGLRGLERNPNPYEVFRASKDAPEVYDAQGILVDGGVHYGHMEVEVAPDAEGRWQATLSPVYVFVTTNAAGQACGFDKRVYNDVLTLTSTLTATQAAVPVTTASIDYANDVPTPAPKAVLETFYAGPLTRGFSWQTDTSVTASELRLLKGVYGAQDEASFARAGTLYTGTCTTVTKPTLNCHLAHTGELEAGATYSYQLGGGGYYVYGQFTVKAPADEVVIVNINDVQTKTAAELYKAENSVAISANTIGGPDKADIYLSGGDIFDLTRFQFPSGQSHVLYGSNPNGNYVYWKWGISVATSTRYYPGVPWLAVSGNHDYTVYRDTVAANWQTDGLSTGGCQSLDYGKVHIATIPYLGSWPGVTAQYRAAFAWLAADLKAASNAFWKVVATHWGPYTTGDHGCSASNEQTDDFLRELTPILSSNHVDIVLQAHDHTYSKTVPYRWNACGYTAETTDPDILNLTPLTTLLEGERFTVNPRGTYYVSCGSCGHRVYESPEYASATGAKSYRNRNPRAVMGTVSLTSKWMEAGSDASRDLNAQMFGVLRFSGRRMYYDWYVAETDGSATKVDTLRVLKTLDSSSGRGTIFSLE